MKIVAGFVSVFAVSDPAPVGFLFVCCATFGLTPGVPHVISNCGLHALAAWLS